MKAYSKKLLLATIAIMPYAFTGEGPHEHRMPDIEALIRDAQEKVAEANRTDDEAQTSFNEAMQSRFALQEMTDEILEKPLDDLTGSIEVIKALLDRTAQVLTSQSEILRILNKQLPYLPQVEHNVRLVRDHQQHIQEQYERIRAQADAQPDNSALQTAREIITLHVNDIESLSQQLLIHKNTIAEKTEDTKEFAQQAVGKTSASITKIRQAVEQFAGKPDLPGQEQEALTITTQIITLLLEIEQSIQTLLEQGLYGEALQGATAAQNVQDALLPITPTHIPAMQTKAQQAQTSADGVKNLIPTPPVPPTANGPASTPTTPGQQPPIPSAPTAPSSAPTQSPVGPPGRALTNINKVNKKLESALSKLDVVKSYFNQIDADERTIVKKKVARIFKEYEPGLKKFAARIKQVKAANAHPLDPVKLAPFDRFLELTDKLSGKIKSL